MTPSPMWSGCCMDDGFFEVKCLFNTPIPIKSWIKPIFSSKVYTFEKIPVPEQCQDPMTVLVKYITWMPSQLLWIKVSAKYSVKVITNLSYSWKRIICWIPSCLVWASHLCPLTVKCQNNADLQITVIHLLMFKWMRARWTSDPCYTFYGVDGSDCSFLVYLSEVEWFCPPLVGRNQSSHPTTSSLPKRQVSAWNSQ